MTTDILGGKRIDLAHLVATLLSLRAPSRSVDRIIEAMLPGSTILQSITALQLKFSNWISDDSIPPYTAGGRAIWVLAHRLGLRVECEAAEGGYQAKATDPVSGISFDAYGKTSGAAACAAMAAVAAARATRSMR